MSVLIKFDAKRFCEGCFYYNECNVKETFEALKCLLGELNPEFDDSYFEEVKENER